MESSLGQRQAAAGSFLWATKSRNGRPDSRLIDSVPSFVSILDALPIFAEGKKHIPLFERSRGQHQLASAFLHFFFFVISAFLAHAVLCRRGVTILVRHVAAEGQTLARIPQCISGSEQPSLSQNMSWSLTAWRSAIAGRFG